MPRKKLVLDPERLRVDTFETVDHEALRGTVVANGYTEVGYPSCSPTCGASPPPNTDLCGAYFVTDPKQCCV
jgi:hypothetical protein